MNPATYQRQAEMVFRRFTTLPDRRQWRTVDRTPYVEQLPDALAGVVRQFSAKMLDLGRLGFDDPERYQIFRSHVFDARDQMLRQLADWLEFGGLTRPDSTALRLTVQEALLR